MNFDCVLFCGGRRDDGYDCTDAANKPSTRRASNKGCLSMSLDQYLRLLDWKSRQIRKNKVGVISADCPAILERLECSAETWMDIVKNFPNVSVTKQACRVEWLTEGLM
jgi:hypothetical protein